MRSQFVVTVKDATVCVCIQIQFLPYKQYIIKGVCGVVCLICAGKVEPSALEVEIVYER